MITRDDKVLIAEVRHAEHWWSRLRGLLLRPPLRGDASEALLITPCASIHTCGMGYPIDVVFIDRQGTVLSVHEAVGPWRFRAQRRARSALELAAGGVRALAIKRGDRLRWRPALEPAA